MKVKLDKLPNRLKCLYKNVLQGYLSDKSESTKLETIDNKEYEDLKVYNNVKFRDLKNSRINEAFSLHYDENYCFVTFYKGGKSYRYKKENIEVIVENSDKAIIKQDKNIPKDFEVIVYNYKKPCWKCGERTEIYTYVVFCNRSPDIECNDFENVTYPYNKPSLLKGADTWSHLEDPRHEYYGCAIIGEIPVLDKVMEEQYSGKIKPMYSNVVKETYMANVCEHCGKIQGKNYIYWDVNDFIKNNIELEIAKRV